MTLYLPLMRGSAREERGNGTMAKTYRDVAIDQMIATVEEAMSRVIDWWGELPMPMNEAIDSFRVQLGVSVIECIETDGGLNYRSDRPI
jgi:hypothetical protein